MRRFLRKPNLPEGRVLAVLTGETYFEKLRPGLAARGAETIPVPENPLVASPLRGHADLSVCHAGEGDWIAAESVYITLKNRFFTAWGEKAGMQKDEGSQSPEYPRDCGLNAAVMGRLAVCGDKCDPVLEKILLQKGLEMIHVRQGYAKCSLCILSEKAAITSDTGIAAALQNRGLEILLIRPGHILLPGYDTGFIGGCCGKLGPRRIAFTGRLDGHPDHEAILRFIAAQGMTAEYLTEEPVFDAGSLLPALEEL
ncbi:DUF6873 family GME fold protein [Papillibacter cinnamivorans]|uniref:DUF6873 domain-containing protein n=1 Tax=Papillibacter cinnamivorans DSM 12816 TaxID=1122930 RepID=A0A1W1ZPH5_9FIRM|nr:hypothetical protein [Papillibacter cinnamivorans]SMC50460.1 hypothetical protein SAMN02745168_1280 [Papillibacter cinnamivorans DSM 12816]